MSSNDCIEVMLTDLKKELNETVDQKMTEFMANRTSSSKLSKVPTDRKLRSTQRPNEHSFVEASKPKKIRQKVVGVPTDRKLRSTQHPNKHSFVEASEPKKIRRKVTEVPTDRTLRSTQQPGRHSLVGANKPKELRRKVPKVPTNYRKRGFTQHQAVSKPKKLRRKVREVSQDTCLSFAEEQDVIRNATDYLKDQTSNRPEQDVDTCARIIREYCDNKKIMGDELRLRITMKAYEEYSRERRTTVSYTDKIIQGAGQILSAVLIPYLNNILGNGRACNSSPAQQSTQNTSCQYMGAWYEQFRYFIVPEVGNICTRVDIKNSDNGSTRYELSFYNTWTEAYDIITGIAKIEGAEGDGKFALNFPHLGNPSIKYQVIDTDYASYAAVVSCDNKDGYYTRNVWIFTRDRFPSEETLKNALQALKKRNVSIRFLHKIDHHSNCSDTETEVNPDAEYLDDVDIETDVEEIK